VTAQPPVPAIHGSCVALGAGGVLIRGRAGAGKSLLALVLLDHEPAGRLVADDRVLVTAGPSGLVAAAPPAIAGLLELRGFGILRLPHVSPAPIDLVVDLGNVGTAEGDGDEDRDGVHDGGDGRPPRLPTAAQRGVRLLGRRLPRLALPAVGAGLDFAAAAAAVRAALAFAPLATD